MKRLSLMALVVAVGVGLAASISETFEFESGILEIGSQDGYTTVTLPVAPHCEPLGAPDLPVVTYHVVIPPTAEVTGFEIVELEEEAVPGSYEILPVQHPVPWSIDYEKQPFVRPDPAYYEVDAVYPAEVARLGTVGNKAGYRLANFGIHPVRCNPVTRQLYLVKHIRVKLDYAAGKRPAVRRTELQNMIHGSWVGRLVLNTADVDRFSPPVRHSGRGSSFLPEGEFEHVIITTSQWEDSLQGLKEWRTRQGWRSTIMLESDITSAYPGRDTPEKIRNFIKDADTTWGTIYVFIARDDYPSHDDVRVTNPYQSYNTKCDMYYTDLDGDWDADNDDIFGEVTDSIDGYADVYVGMITITDGSELSNYMRKIFAYEQNPDTSVQWVTKQILPNGVTFSDEFNDSCAVASPDPPWYDLKMYASDSGQIKPTPERYKDSLESGYSVGSVIAHGSPDLFQIGGNVESSLFLGMDNPGRLHFSTHVCCNTGEWNRGSTNGDCIAENAAFHAQNGTIGVLHNDKSGWVRCAELFNFAHMFGFFGYNTERRPTMGEINSYGKDFWVWTFQDSWKYRMEAQERNLFGEPAVPVWHAQPVVVSVSRPGAINIGNNIAVPITVTDNSDAPVESTMVCLIKGDETFARGWTDASGQLTLYVSPLTPGFMDLTISGGLHLPVLDSIVVMASGRYVSYIHHFITDSAPEGNGDGIINPGEEVRTHTWVKNYGTETAVDVTGELRIHETGVTVTDPTVDFGDIPAEDSALSQTGFGVLFDPGLPDDFQVRCSVVCKDDLDSTWISYLTLRSYSASLYHVDAVIKDSMATWPNGRLDPTEDIELEVSVANQGMGNSFEARGVLRALDSLSVVTDTHALYGTVLSGSTVVCTDRFGIKAHDHLPPESRLHFELDIIWDHGNDTTVYFELFSGGMVSTDPMPDGPRLPPLYFAYDDDDVFYSEAPTYDWVEIRDFGTSLDLQDQETKALALPDAFGPLVFYDEEYDTISVCSNGWIAPGVTTDRAWQNRELPTSRNRALIAVLWDDLLPPYGGNVLYWHDEDNNRFVIEWDSVHYSWAREDWDEFQIVLFDTTEAADDGNTVFIFQYKTANNYVSTTIGEQPYWTSPDTIGIGCLFNGTYHRGASVVVPQTAIKFTTNPPELLGVEEEKTQASLLRGRTMVVAPNPFNNNALVHWNLERDADVSLQVFDASGRAVRTLISGPRAAGTYTTTWNGKDDAGRELARGIYFVRLKTPSEMVKTKTILAR